MSEITSIILENEMDLVLAHKQSMRLIELSGSSLPSQTTFATAVSEIARLAIDNANGAILTLSVDGPTRTILATIKDSSRKFITTKTEGYKYAQKLVSKIELEQNLESIQVKLYHNMSVNIRIDNELLEKWSILLNNDPSVSPYEEIKRKNKQLVDISEKLRQSEERYRDLTNALPLLIFTLNKDGNVTYANDWLQQYTGQTIDTLNETNWRSVIHPDEKNDLWENWRDDEFEYVPISVETRLKNVSTGDYRWYTGIITPMLNDSGELLYWTAYLADIHAQKTVEEALKDNKELKETQEILQQKIGELNRSNTELEQFAYIASHDLQEPLRKINFYSDYLKKSKNESLSINGNLFVDNILSATDRMKILINDILAFSTVNQNTATFSIVDLNVVLNESLHDLEIAIKDRNAKIDFESLPRVYGDHNKLKQLFENIISNALKYVDDNVSPRIEIYCETDQQFVKIYFKDNGIGFELQYLDKMFTIFQRLHGRDKYSGTGIGLSICKKIVNIHKGEITAISSPGQGATFIITLPAINSQND